MIPIKDVPSNFVDNWDSAVDFMNWLSQSDRTHLAVDTETSGLRTNGHSDRRDKIRMIQVGSVDGGWAIPWHSYSGLWEEVVRRFTGRYIMHNAKFDQSMLDNERPTVRLPRNRIDDTAIMSHLLSPVESKALKSQATSYIDAQAASAQKLLYVAMEQAGWTWATVPIDFPPYWVYSCLDTVLTARLFEHHQPLIAQTCPDAYDLELAVQWVIMDMERRGVFVDRFMARETEKRFLDEAREIEAITRSEYDLLPGQLARLSQRFLDDGIQLWEVTDGGAWKMNREVLEGIDHPLAEMVLRWRRLVKLSSTYLRHFAEDADENDLLHPSINSLEARTGRMSMSEPNLQNLPRRNVSNPEANSVRDCVMTRYGEDGTLLMCDFDQIEMRLLAHLSGDPGLREAFSSDSDFFVELARAIYRDSELVKNDPRRSITKNVGYAQIYGAGLEKLAATARVSVNQVQIVKDRWDTLYPGVRRFQNAVTNRAWARARDGGAPYVVSPLTGRHYIASAQGKSFKVYALVNYLIQGLAAEIFKRKILELDAAGLGEFMCVPVHDEIVLDIPLDQRDAAVDILRDVMNDEKTFRVPVTASVSAGVRWGQKQEVEEL